MSRLENKSVTIYEAVMNIETGKYLMPAFQRQYVWSMYQIEKLWDSILQGYPISTFLFWHVDDNNVSNDTKFCSFLKSVRFDSTKNADSINYELVDIKLDTTNIAVLDGQQRLTSLFLSLLGSTGIMQRYQRKNDTTQVQTKLLIQLNENKIELQDEISIKGYDIKFTDKVGRIDPTQFEIKNIMNERFKNKDMRENAIEDAIRLVPVNSKDYARNTLKTLCEKVFDETLINYIELFDMTHDDALEMFVRFNSGGKPLKKADITMSILEAYWGEAKNKFGKLLTSDFEGFGIDFIIRTAHMIYGDVVKSNISKQVVKDLMNNWDLFTDAFKKTSLLIKDFKIDIHRFSNSWNVLVPIIFCIYYNPNYLNFKNGIQAYLKRAILFTFFQSGTTSKLQKIKKNIMDNEFEITSDMLDQLSDFIVTDAKIDDLLMAEKNSRIAGELLYYLSLDWIRKDVKYEQDHLHPDDRFYKDKPYGVDMTTWSEWRKMHNRIPNLHYLEGRPNSSKQNIPLQQYYDEMTQQQKDDFVKNSFIPIEESLDIANFGNFFEKRKELLKKEIIKILS